jgi:hypothetical protein
LFRLLPQTSRKNRILAASSDAKDAGERGPDDGPEAKSSTVQSRIIQMQPPLRREFTIIFRGEDGDERH